MSTSTGRPYSVARRAQHVQLERADDADHRGRTVDRSKHLHDALFRHFLQRLLEFLCLHGVGEPHPTDDFRRETRHADKVKFLAFGKRIADAQAAVIWDAYHSPA